MDASTIRAGFAAALELTMITSMFGQLQHLATVFAAVRLASGSTFFPIKPPAFPLAVKSPYMSTWLEAGTDGSDGGILPGHWPKFWAGEQPGSVLGGSGAVTGWAGLINVDGTVYTWMGAPSPQPTLVTQESAEFTSQRTTFIMNVGGKVSMNVTFLSPLNPTDLKRQSIIGSYLDVSVVAIDGATHTVHLYADTSAEWVSSTHNTDTAQWSYGVNAGVASHQSWRTPQSVENSDYPDDGAHWGNWYWSTASKTGLTYQSGQDITVRGNFIANGVLPNTADTNFRAINNDWPVFGFASALGTVGTTAVSTLYTLVHAQEQAIYFNGASGNVSVPSLWTAYWSADLDMVAFFYGDWVNEVGAIDHQFAVDSLAAGGQDYLTITSLSARQAFGAVQLCGTTAKPYLFLKEISSDGNIQTVDVIFPAIPIFIYSNPILIKYMLDPLFENQEAGLFPQKYAMHDLGANYPRAIGHEDGGGEAMQVEESGNMIIMTLAYAQRASDTAYLTQHYTILKQWANFLVTDSLIPANQLSTDDFQGTLANQTNLALKGIIGIQAMAVIAELTGNTGDAANFQSTAQSYIQQWQELGIAPAGTIPAHTTLAYGKTSTHGLLYNLYSDKLLGLNLVPESVYSMQSNFYPTVEQKWGFDLDTRNTNTKSDWEMWTAAICETTTKTLFISKLASWLANTPTNRAFTDLYDTGSGNWGTGQFVARPVVGGHFALLALNDAPTGVIGKRKDGRRVQAFFA